MRITIDIPEGELREAIRHTKARSEHEAVVTALIDFNRCKRLQCLTDEFGTFDDLLSHEELRRLREEE